MFQNWLKCDTYSDILQILPKFEIRPEFWPEPNSSGFAKWHQILAGVRAEIRHSPNFNAPPLNFPLPSVLLAKRVKKFDDKINACNNLLCKINIR